MNCLVFVKVVKGELSPFDEAALETALRLREDDAANAAPSSLETARGTVTVVTMAPDSAADRMKALTRLGVDRSILISDRAFAGSDTAATSYILSLAAKKLMGEDTLILCGRQSMDGDTAQVGVSLAARLNIPCITNVMGAEKLWERKITCVTRLSGEPETAALPALLTVERIAKLRFAPMRARAHEIERWSAAELSPDLSKCGLNGSPTKVLKSFESTRGRRFCKFLSPEEFLDKIEELKARPRARIVPAESMEKLPEVFAVGEDTAQIASRIAGKVVVFERMEGKNDWYVEEFRRRKPDVVLFPADLWGRRTAPYVATKLETGLCADCTLLETDGKKLFMYRPAFGGNVTAKIECRTLPQMATVRTVSESADFIVSAGLGVKGETERFGRFLSLLGAEPGASRGLVDAGLAPYEWQVGVTGRTVAPKIYLAVGISGAVHHTAAIEGAESILAVNPDRGAPIFDFCDYGCVCGFDEIDEILEKNSSKM